jgi:hypothetical protein
MATGQRRSKSALGLDLKASEGYQTVRARVRRINWQLKVSIRFVGTGIWKGH